MKTLLKLAASAVLGLSMTATAVAADELVVATDTAFVPFEFKEGDKYVGFDIDMWSAIATELGLEYKLQPMDFAGIIPAVQTGHVFDIDSSLVLQPGPAALTDGVRRIREIIEDWQGHVSRRENTGDST